MWFLDRSHPGVTSGLARATIDPDRACTSTYLWIAAITAWMPHMFRTSAIVVVHAGRHLGCDVRSPDGNRVVTVSSDQTMRLWDVQTGKEIALEKPDWQGAERVVQLSRTTQLSDR